MLWRLLLWMLSGCEYQPMGRGSTLPACWECAAWLRVTPSELSGARPPAGEGIGRLVGGEDVRADGSIPPWGLGSGAALGGGHRSVLASWILGSPTDSENSSGQKGFL